MHYIINKKRVLVFSLLVFLFLLVLVSGQEESENSGGGFLGGIFASKSPIVGDWYGVTDAEILFCQQWGGYANLYSSSSITEDSLPPVGKLTLTVQGLYTELVDEKRLYEVAWYVHPLTGDIAYVVYLVDAQGRKEEAEYGRGNANALDGDSNYVAFESEKEYAYVLLEVEGGGTLQVPFVEKEQ